MLPPALTPQLLRQIELFRLRSRRSFLGQRQGGHVSTKKGHGIEFSDYREYTLGDNPRWIEWGVFARSDRLYVRRYQEEQNLSVLVIVDASPSMWSPRGDQKWERARDIALSLSYLAFVEQERVTLAVPGYHTIPATSGGAAIHRLSEVLLNIKEPAPRHDLQKETLGILSRIRIPGIAIVVSDFLWPLEEARSFFNLLRAKNLDATAIQVLGPHDEEPFRQGESAVAIDSETGEELQVSFEGDRAARYKYLLDSHNGALKDFCNAHRIGFVSTSSATPLSHNLFATMGTTGLLER